MNWSYFFKAHFLPVGVFVSKSSSEASSSSSTMVHLRRNEAAASDGENRLSTVRKKQILLIGVILDPVLAIFTRIYTV